VEVIQLKFDKHGHRVTASSAFEGTTPETYQELRDLGIENSSMQVIADMIHSNKSYDAFKIILEMARSRQ